MKPKKHKHRHCWITENLRSIWDIKQCTSCDCRYVTDKTYGFKYYVNKQGKFFTLPKCIK